MYKEEQMSVSPMECNQLFGALVKMPLRELLARACDIRLEGHGILISYSRKSGVQLEQPGRSPLLPTS